MDWLGFNEGDKVFYTGPNFPERVKTGVCVSDEYTIREWTFINVTFGSESGWHPINIENLQYRDLTKNFDMVH